MSTTSRPLLSTTPNLLMPKIWIPILCLSLALVGGVAWWLSSGSTAPESTVVSAPAPAPAPAPEAPPILPIQEPLPVAVPVPPANPSSFASSVEKPKVAKKSSRTSSRRGSHSSYSKKASLRKRHRIMKRRRHQANKTT